MPDAFWELTPFEVGLVIEGYGERRRDDLEIAAWVTSHVINLWSKKKVSPKKLLGSVKKSANTISADQFPSLEAFRKYLKEQRSDE